MVKSRMQKFIENVTGSSNPRQEMKEEEKKEQPVGFKELLAEEEEDCNFDENCQEIYLPNLTTNCIASNPLQNLIEEEKEQLKAIADKKKVDKSILKVVK
jgi:hypothetical protein